MKPIGQRQKRQNAGISGFPDRDAGSIAIPAPQGSLDALLFSHVCPRATRFDFLDLLDTPLCLAGRVLKLIL